MAFGGQHGGGLFVMVAFGGQHGGGLFVMVASGGQHGGGSFVMVASGGGHGGKCGRLNAKCGKGRCRDVGYVEVGGCGRMDFCFPCFWGWRGGGRCYRTLYELVFWKSSGWGRGVDRGVYITTVRMGGFGGDWFFVFLMNNLPCAKRLGTAAWDSSLGGVGGKVWGGFWAAGDERGWKVAGGIFGCREVARVDKIRTPTRGGQRRNRIHVSGTVHAKEGVVLAAESGRTSFFFVSIWSC